MNLNENQTSSPSHLLGKDFKRKSDIHWARKTWHMGGVLVIYFLFQNLPLPWSKALIVIGWLSFLILDFARKKYPSVNIFLVHYLKPIMRQHEIENYAGTTYLMSGAAVLIIFFNPKIVSLSLLFLAFADPFASFFGIKFGKDKIYGDKTLQGYLAAFVICAGLTFGYLYLKNFSVGRIMIASLLSGFLGATAELIPIKKLDDNLTLPIVSGIGLTAIFYIFDFL